MHNCKKCSAETNELNREPVPYFVHEMEMYRSERREKRMISAVIVLSASMLLSNLAWLIAFVG